MWAVALAVLLAGVFLYRPLKLRYAIYRVRNTDYTIPDGHGAECLHPDKWLMLCLDEACRGDRTAMQVVVDCPEIVRLERQAKHHGAVPRSPKGIPVTFIAAQAQPALFFDLLDQRDDATVIRALSVTMWQCCDPDDPNAQLEDILEAMGGAMRRLGGIDRISKSVAVVWLEAGFLALRRSKRQETRCIAECALTLLHRRFARELAEAQKKPTGEARQ
jgi:hypothetical protein